MAHASLVPSLDADVHLVLCDFGRAGLAYVETDPMEADATAIVRNLLRGEYGRPLRIIAINAEEGWSRDVSELYCREDFLAADHVENGINLGSEDGQRALELLLNDVDLLILDNLSTLCTSGGESASDAWVPMQNWLLMLRRRGIAVLFIHHAGTNGRQRGTSRRGMLWTP